MSQATQPQPVSFVTDSYQVIGVPIMSGGHVTEWKFYRLSADGYSATYLSLPSGASNYGGY